MAFHALLKLSTLHDGYKQAFNVAGKSILVIQKEDKVYLIENSCPHMSVPLVTGTVTDDNTIRCRSHGIEFQLTDGKALGSLAGTLNCLTLFKPVYDGKTLGVDL